MKLFNCDSFLKAFEEGHCAYTPVCTEGKCPYVLLEDVDRLEDALAEYKSDKNYFKELENKNNDLEDEKNSLKEENQNLKIWIQNITKYIENKFDKDFKLTDKILSGIDRGDDES